MILADLHTDKSGATSGVLTLHRGSGSAKGGFSLCPARGAPPIIHKAFEDFARKLHEHVDDATLYATLGKKRRVVRVRVYATKAFTGTWTVHVRSLPRTTLRAQEAERAFTRLLRAASEHEKSRKRPS